MADDYSEINSHPDKDNCLAIAASIILFKICQLTEEDLKQVTNLTSNLPPETIVSHFLLGHHKVVSSTLIEVFIWLLQDDYESPMYSVNFSDDVVVQRVLKIVTLMDKKKFDVRKLKEDPYICKNLPKSFCDADDQFLVKQV